MDGYGSSVGRRWRRRAVGVAAPALAAAGAGVFALSAPPAGATPSSCIVTVAELDASLGIAAAHVTTVHRSSPAGALICSYYGNTGRAANGATVNFLPASKGSFALNEKVLSATHAVRGITGIKSGAFSYSIGTTRYLYVLDGSTMVQMYAIVPLANLEALGKKLPALPG